MSWDTQEENCKWTCWWHLYCAVNTSNINISSVCSSVIMNHLGICHLDIWTHCLGEIEWHVWKMLRFSNVTFRRLDVNRTEKLFPLFYSAKIIWLWVLCVVPVCAWTAACVRSPLGCSRRCSCVSGWCWAGPGGCPWSWGWTGPHCGRSPRGRTVGCRTGERLRALGWGAAALGGPGCAGVEAHQPSPDGRGGSGRKAGSAWRRPAVAAAGTASRWWHPSGSVGPTGGPPTYWSRQSQLTASHRTAAGCSAQTPGQSPGRGPGRSPGRSPGRHRPRCSALRSCPYRRWRPGRSWACPPTAG